jgi:hypothetical protein
MNAKHRSSFSTAPILRPDGKAELANLGTPDSVDCRIIEALGLHNNLTAADLQPILKCNKSHLYERLQILAAEPNLLIRLSAEQINDPNIFRKRTWFLTAKAAAWLKERGLQASTRRVHRGYQNHANLVSHITASLYTGIQQTDGFEFLPSIAVRSHSHFKQPANESPNHPVIPHPAKGQIVPDTDFLCIHSANKYRFLVIEADNGTETITPRNPEKYEGSSLYEKFEAIVPFIESKGYHTKYGLPNLWWLFCLPNEKRLFSAMMCLGQFKSPAARYILFLVTRPDDPSGYIFTAPYQRVGFEPLQLNQQ